MPVLAVTGDTVISLCKGFGPFPHHGPVLFQTISTLITELTTTANVETPIMVIYLKQISIESHEISSYLGLVVFNFFFPEVSSAADSDGGELSLSFSL